ncbi:MAG: hypothetical protein MZW92_77205 [Comamonadaceae bacterium]|nr:hypothetical protein [Comamonadaceae bacterium]
MLALVAATAGRGTLAADVPAAEPAVPLQAEDERQLIDRAAALRADAGQRRQAAERQLTQRNAACQRKFLVSSCLEKARRDHVDSKQEARRLEQQANDIERELTRRQRALDAAERERRAAEKQQDAQRFRARARSPGSGVGRARRRPRAAARGRPGPRRDGSAGAPAAGRRKGQAARRGSGAGATAGRGCAAPARRVGPPHRGEGAQESRKGGAARQRRSRRGSCKIGPGALDFPLTDLTGVR